MAGLKYPVTIMTGCLYSSTLYLAKYSDISYGLKWTVGACILVLSICPDIWTLAKVAGGLRVPVSWSPVFARIFGHWS